MHALCLGIVGAPLDRLAPHNLCELKIFGAGTVRVRRLKAPEKALLFWLDTYRDIDGGLGPYDSGVDYRDGGSVHALHVGMVDVPLDRLAPHNPREMLS